MVGQPRHDAAGQRASLRQQYSNSGAEQRHGSGAAETLSTCSFSDSEAGWSSEGQFSGQLRHGLSQPSHDHHADGPHAQQLHQAHAQQPQRMQQQSPQQQQHPPQQQQSLQDRLGSALSTMSPQISMREQPKQEAAPARIIQPHLSRADVSRGILHHVAKAFGIHLKGDVATNEISTAKYTLLTFLPVNLFEQFLRVANMYFLLMAILQFIPGLSPTSWFTTVAPLVFVLAVNAIKEGYDDVHRHRCAGLLCCAEPAAAVVRQQYQWLLACKCIRSIAQTTSG